MTPEDTGKRPYTTPIGHMFGALIADLAENHLQEAAALMPNLPARCGSCAFRKGSHPANGHEHNLSKIAFCLTKGERFGCHDHKRQGDTCSGWRAINRTRGIDMPAWLRETRNFARYKVVGNELLENDRPILAGPKEFVEATCDMLKRASNRKVHEVIFLAHRNNGALSREIIDEVNRTDYWDRPDVVARHANGINRHLSNSTTT